ncbi:class III lanthionine synthetase LanKC [Streptomyces sp. NBC_01275]|uniref:class III lanthionine synthetase LanKC n=1 Tax=Streptomyces sp. NBC_01275 TaxID=2903807 RepID=UPI002251421E|nr:class III lanthionine synthetase LanKC [Streptomyces sp. NBC_01275]MCX4760395.1 class III lanthionine synthetase LanKC [Streptomyces sp. NBC_01275]
MGLTGFELHAMAHPLFFDVPGRLKDDATKWPPPEIGSGRRRESEADIWTRVDFGRPLPEQGWKIHVSTTGEDAQRVLGVVAAVCARRQVAFKYLRSAAMLKSLNSKYAHRGSSGKFLAVYPSNEDELRILLEELDTALAGFRGPYVLSDLRWSDESPVFLRYGAFAEIMLEGTDGAPITAVRTPDGTLVEDRRGASFQVPDGVVMPAFLRERLDQLSALSRVEMPYEDIRPLHYSNGGGVYVGKDPRTGEQVVLKEARPYAAVDSRGLDAVARLRHEHTMLLKAQETDHSPRVHDYLTLWEHHFLVQEYVEGQTLGTAVLSRYPGHGLGQGERMDVSTYTQWATESVSAVEGALSALHDAGIVFGDVHPQNIIVRPDGRYIFIDFEAAHPVGTPRTGLAGAAGFAAPAGTEGVAIDDHGLAAVKLYHFAPFLALSPLDVRKSDEFATWAQERFPLPAGFTRSAASTLRQGKPEADSDGPDLRTASPAEHAELVARAVRSSATPTRADRLFPGPPTGLGNMGGVCLREGAAGVLYALHATGQPLEEEWIDWLSTTMRTLKGSTVHGLFAGVHGAATVLDLLGRREQAARLVERTLSGKAPTTLSLYSGLPGVGLSLLGFQARTGDSAYLTAAGEYGDRVVAALEREDEQGLGLAAGRAAAALFLVRLYERIGDKAYLHSAGKALDAEIARIGLDPESEAAKELSPTLGTGVAGTALALNAWLAHQHDVVKAAALSRCRRAVRDGFQLAPGLLSGAAGQLYTLSVLGHQDDRPAVEDLARNIWRFSVPFGNGAAFPYENLFRLSMCLGAGSTGVLLALESARRHVDLLAPLLGGPSTGIAPQ